MADVISICDKLDRAKLEKDATLDRRKQRAIKHLFQRSCCALDCEKCGLPIGRACAKEGCPKVHDHRVPYQFCDDCTEEFIDYIERLKGRGDPDCYWRNEAWLEVWSTWINHRAALDRHARSSEFARLLQEIKDITSE
ncbi:MAG: hypothetical protein PVJ53_09525 [Desulfobacterales bacterium]